MEAMFDLSMPWWQFCVRAVLVYAALLLLIRLSGKRTVGEFTPFDLIVVILLGESMQSALVGDDKSVAGPIVAAATLIALNYFVGFASARSKAVDKITEGGSVTLLRNGRVFDAELKKHNVPESDVEEAAREQGVASLKDVQLATLEANGHITIVPKKRAK